METEQHSEHLTVLALAHPKVHPALAQVGKRQPVTIHISDWSWSVAALWRNWQLMRASDVIYLHSPTNMRIFAGVMARLLGKPIVIQWIGDDVLTMTFDKRPPLTDLGTGEKHSVASTLQENRSGLARLILSAIMRYRHAFLRLLRWLKAHHITCAPHLATALAEVGVTADEVPLTSAFEPELAPLPDDFAVLSYTGIFNHLNTTTFYGWSSITRLAQDFPDLTIHIIGHGTPPKDLPNNIRYHGFLSDVKPVLRQAKALLRLTYHDGLPRMMQEALAMGRYVIYTQPYPHTIHVESYEQLKTAVAALREKEEPNLSGYEYILKLFNQEQATARYYAVFQRASNHKRED